MTISKNNLLIFTALLIALLFFVSNPDKIAFSKYNYSLGQISDRDVIAPFDFRVHKSPEALQADQKRAAQMTEPIYRVSENLKFNAQKNLDFIFQHFNIASTEQDSSLIRQKLLENGYEISPSSVNFLNNLQNRQIIYEYLSSELSKIFYIGIYPANIASEQIKMKRNNKLEDYKLGRLYSLEEAKAKLISNISGDLKQKIIQELADIILIENIVIDKELTEASKAEARDSVSLYSGRVQKNEKILDKNQKITRNELDKLNSLKLYLEEAEGQNSLAENFLSSLGAFLLMLILLFFLKYILIIIFPHEYSTFTSLLILALLVLGSALLTFIANSLLEIPALYVPMLLPVLLITVLYDIKLGLIFNFINFIVIAFFLNWSFVEPLLFSITALAGISVLHRMKKKQNYYQLTIYLFAAFFLVLLAFSLTRFEETSIFLSKLLAGLTSLVISMIALSLLTPIIERKLNMATKQVLLELLDFDNPLLKKISATIPGTYHHALIVGNLAESAAEAIGANHLLTRVASYYHDIGKVENAPFFIENNPVSSQLHEKLLPNQSALLIKKHITDGIALAQKYNLPKQVIDIIQQHHGTSFIRYFYNLAQEEKLSINEKDFRYDGPKPKSKEAAIVMIADIVESTTKSLPEIKPDIVLKVLDDTVNNLIFDGQLDDAPITLEELTKIKNAMIPILNGVYNKRIEYPKNDQNNH
ncbi:MAG: HDIG domain-containing protein [Candidatus Cloacimonadales bacterium]